MATLVLASLTQGNLSKERELCQAAPAPPPLPPPPPLPDVRGVGGNRVAAGGRPCLALDSELNLELVGWLILGEPAVVVEAGLLAGAHTEDLHLGGKEGGREGDGGNSEGMMLPP